MAASKRKQRPTIETSKPVTETWSRTFFDWSPAQIRAAETAADGGNLRLAADLCELMMTDDRIMRCNEALAGIASLPLTFQPPGPKGDPATDPISLALQEDWWRFNPESELAQMIAWGRLLGVSLAHVDEWRADEDTGRLLPITTVWHPKHLRYDFVQRAWFVRLDDGQDVQIEEGGGTWILHRPYGARRPWAKAPWRWLARLWLLKRYAAADWAHFSGRQGQPRDVIEQKAGEDAEELTREQRNQLANDFRTAGRDMAAVLPKGFTHKLVESVAKSYESFKEQTELANSGFVVSLVGQNLTSTVEGGSRAAATVHDSVEWRVIRKVAEPLSTDLREQQLTWYTEYNYGNRRLTPWPKYDTKPPTDHAARADVLLKVAQFLKTCTEAGVKPDLQAISEEFDVALEQVEALNDRQNGTGNARGNGRASGGQNARTLAARAAAGRAGATDSSPGQQYADRLEAQLTPRAVDELRPTLTAVLAAVREASTYEEAYTAMLKLYEGIEPPVELARATEAALLLAHLGGQLEVAEQTAEA